MKRFIITICTVLMLTLFGMGETKQAEAQFVTVRRGPIVYGNRIQRNYNRGYRSGYRTARRYYTPSLYRAPRYGYAGYRYYGRGYRNGFVATPFFSVGF